MDYVLFTETDVHLLDYVFIRLTKKEPQVVRENRGQIGRQDLADEERISEKSKNLEVELIYQQMGTQELER